MMRKILIVLLIISSWNGFSQGLKVLISEVKTGKRVVLFAENKTQDTVNVFLMVNAEGYRRSAAKPVIKNIAPGDNVPMITLIELDGEESKYTFEMIVNDKESDINFSYDEPERDIERVIKGQLVIFSSEGCTKCTLLSELLETQRIQHRIFNINEDAVLYGQFMSFIERRLTVETKIRFPVIWNKDEVIFGYDDLEEVLKDLQQ